MSHITIQFAKHFYQLSKDLKESETGKWRYEGDLLIGRRLSDNEISLFLKDKLKIK